MIHRDKGSKMKLGVFVTIGLGLFIIAIYFIGKKQFMFNRTFQISGIFKNISGLQAGNNVRLSGINIGTVEDIAMDADTAVRVDMIIDERTRKYINKNIKATISTDGLMGNKIVVLLPEPGAAPEIQDKDYIATSVPISIDDITSKLNRTGANLADMTGDLSAIVSNIRNGRGTIGKLFMDTVFAKNIDQTIVNIKQGTKGFKQNMDAASHSILLRGYLKKKEKEKKDKEKEQQKNEQ